MVTPDDWDRLADGNERKLQIIFGNKFPRRKWPVGIPYLNMIALAQYVERSKQKSVMKTLASEKDTTKTTHRKKRLTKIAPNASVMTKKATKRNTPRKPEVELHSAAPVPNSPSKVADTSLQESPRSVQAEIHRLECEYEQSKMQLSYIVKSRRDPTSVSLKQWQDAVRGTDVAQVDRRTAGYMELARRRAVGEECDGWAYGMYFGP